MDKPAPAAPELASVPPRSWRWPPLACALGVAAVLALAVYLAQTPSVDRLYEAGVKANETKDYATAVAKFSEVLRLRPEDGEAFSLRGYAHFNRGDHAQAIADETQAIRLLPRHAHAYAIRAYAYFLTKQYDQALADAAQALAIEPRQDQAHSISGHCHFQKRDFAEAVRSYTEAIRLNPKEPYHYVHRGLAHVEAKDHAAALADLDEALRLDPKNVHAYTNRSYAYCQNKDYAQAEADGRNALRVHPESECGYMALAWIWATCPDAKMRNGPKAVEYAKACELTAWKSYWSLHALAAACAEVGRFDGALRRERQAQEAADGWATADLPNARKALRLYEERQPFRDE